MKILALILIFTIIALFEFPGLVKKKEWRELITSSVLLAIGFMLSFLQVIGVKVPNPNKGIEALVKFFTS